MAKEFDMDKHNENAIITITLLMESLPNAMKEFFAHIDRKECNEDHSGLNRATMWETINTFRRLASEENLSVIPYVMSSKEFKEFELAYVHEYTNSVSMELLIRSLGNPAAVIAPVFDMGIRLGLALAQETAELQKLDKLMGDTPRE